jgi:ADP-ribosyl-[dinitrogen reductase] hydrolase
MKLRADRSNAKNPPEIQGTGYVVSSLEAALWSFQSTDSFEAAVLKAANLGDDADTTAAICGQLAGAF